MPIKSTDSQNQMLEETTRPKKKLRTSITWINRSKKMDTIIKI